MISFPYPTTTYFSVGVIVRLFILALLISLAVSFHTNSQTRSTREARQAIRYLQETDGDGLCRGIRRRNRRRRRARRRERRRRRRARMDKKTAEAISRSIGGAMEAFFNQVILILNKRVDMGLPQKEEATTNDVDLKNPIPRRNGTAGGGGGGGGGVLSCKEVLEDYSVRKGDLHVSLVLGLVSEAEKGKAVAVDKVMARKEVAVVGAAVEMVVAKVVVDSRDWVYMVSAPEKVTVQGKVVDKVLDRINDGEQWYTCILHFSTGHLHSSD